MSFVVEVFTIGGSLPDFLEASFSGRPFSAPSVSVSMSVVLRGVKKLRANAAFGGSLTPADVETGLSEFLADCEVTSWGVESDEVFSPHHCVCLALTCRKAR
jgi:hypothetical protein